MISTKAATSLRLEREHRPGIVERTMSAIREGLARARIAPAGAGTLGSTIAARSASRVAAGDSRLTDHAGLHPSRWSRLA